MKHVIGVVLLLVSLVVSAQEPGGGRTFLRNLTPRTLYVLDQARDDSITPEAPYRQVPPRGLLPVDPGAAIRGFAFERGSFVLSTFEFSPDRLAELTRTRASRTYVPVEDRHLVANDTLQASRFDQLLALPRIDNQYLDWVGREASIARAPDRQPVASFVDLGEGREELDLANSLVWQKGGTNIEWIKGFADESELFLAVSSYSVFSDQTSLFLYLYEDEATVPTATLEVPAGAENGFVYLWTPTRVDPLVVGNVVSSDFFLEAQVWSSLVATTLGEEFLSLTVNVSTGNASAGVWEEFLVARVPFASLFGE
jgi:hypothetical protein